MMLVLNVRLKNETIHCSSFAMNIGASGTTRANEYKIPMPHAKDRFHFRKSEPREQVVPVLPMRRRKGKATIQGRLPQTI